jgi:hypothetical protein
MKFCQHPGLGPDGQAVLPYRSPCLVRTMAIIPAWRANASVLTSSPDRPPVVCADFYAPADRDPRTGGPPRHVLLL